MSSRKLHICVTGGLGFIGKHFVSYMLDNGHYVHNIDALTYAADRMALVEFEQYENYQFTKCAIQDLKYLPLVDAVINFSAETHVDNSLADNKTFCETNIMGVRNLLELIRIKSPTDRPKLVHISTDEVYGDLLSGSFTEEDKLHPSNPYSATKAASDMLIMGWGRTYKLDYIIIRPTNTYGSHQFPEKLIPKTITRIARGLSPIVHGKGDAKRTWLHVDDLSAAIELVLNNSLKGHINKEVINVSGNIELSNLEVITKISNLMDFNQEPEYVEDRIAQDVRYAISNKKIRSLGWKPTSDFDEALQKIIEDFDPIRFVQPWDPQVKRGLT